MSSVSIGPWGLNADDRPKTVQEAATERIEQAIADHIRTRLGIAEATGLDKHAVDQIRNLHLAEPWLPAVTAVEMLEMAGLLQTDQPVPHSCPACGARHRVGWIFPHTCGHNGCKHECEIVDEVPA